MLVAAAALGLVVGVVVGGLGGGGGVLAVPALVYVLGQTAQGATASSVVIVGITAAAGVLARVRGHGVDWRTAVAFGIVGIPAAYLGTLLNHRVAEPVLLLAFAGLTLGSAAAMLLDARGGHGADAPVEPAPAGTSATAVATRARYRRLAATTGKVLVCGAFVGFLTGFLGVGGGFLVVPALVIVLGMPMSLAVGTSLLIIVLNALAAVASRIGVVHLDWHVVVPFTIAAVAGTFAGKRVADRISGDTLERVFAGMLAVVGLFVGIQSVVAL